MMMMRGRRSLRVSNPKSYILQALSASFQPPSDYPVKCLYRSLLSASRAFSDLLLFLLDFFGGDDFDDFELFDDLNDLEVFDCDPYLLFFPFPLPLFLPLPFDFSLPPASGDCVAGVMAGAGTKLGNKLGELVRRAVSTKLGGMVLPVGRGVPTTRLGGMVGAPVVGRGVSMKLGESLGAWLTKSHSSIWAVASSVKTTHEYVSSVKKGYTEQLLEYLKMASIVTSSPPAFSPRMSNCIPCSSQITKKREMPCSMHASIQKGSTMIYTTVKSKLTHRRNV